MPIAACECVTSFVCRTLRTLNLLRLADDPNGGHAEPRLGCFLSNDRFDQRARRRVRYVSKEDQGMDRAAQFDAVLRREAVRFLAARDQMPHEPLDLFMVIRPRRYGLPWLLGGHSLRLARCAGEGNHRSAARAAAWSRVRAYRGMCGWSLAPISRTVVSTHTPRHSGRMVRRIIDEQVSVRRLPDGSLEYDVVRASYDDDEADDFDGDVDGAPFVEGLPVTSRGQHCLCGAEPTWVYRVAAADRAFRVGDKGFTLPNFVTLCAMCKELAERHDAHGLLERRLGRENDNDWERQIAEGSSIALARADLTIGRPLSR